MTETFRVILNDEVKLDKFVKDAFKKVDSDESGTIDKKELIVILTEIANYIGANTPKEEDAKAVFNFLDTDHSGSITIDEFKILIKDILNHIVSNSEEFKLTKVPENMNEKIVQCYSDFIHKFATVLKTNVFGNIYPLGCFCSALPGILYYLSQLKAINFDATAFSTYIFFGGIMKFICGGIDFAFNREFSAFSNITGGIDNLVYRIRGVLHDVWPGIKPPGDGGKKVYTLIWVIDAIFFAIAARKKGTLLITIKYYLGIAVNLLYALLTFYTHDAIQYIYGAFGLINNLINLYLGCVSIVNLEYGRDVFPV